MGKRNKSATCPLQASKGIPYNDGMFPGFEARPSWASVKMGKVSTRLSRFIAMMAFCLVWGGVEDAVSGDAPDAWKGMANSDPTSELNVGVVGHGLFLRKVENTLTWPGQSDSLALRDLYLQQHVLSLDWQPYPSHAFVFECPVNYGYYLIGNRGYSQTWSLGDLRLAWRKTWYQGEHGQWQSLTGILVPTATHGVNDYLLTDLEALPIGRRIGRNQGPHGADGLRILIGLSPSGNWDIGLPFPVVWNLYCGLRQPFGQASNDPFTLMDAEASLSIPLLDSWSLKGSAGQTRALLPLAVLNAAAPSASHIQAELTARLSERVGMRAGVRWNPLQSEEKEPYAVETKTKDWAKVDWAIEPPLQLRLGFVFGFFDAENQGDVSASHRVGKKGDPDGDGIFGAQDHCPNVPEDRDGFHDEDGCPEIDNDRDGIPDTSDLCPNDAEDMDGFQDNDGCPDLDNDRDGIPDAQDRCPNAPETFNHSADRDGCPDADSDGDGIDDAHDACPNAKETINFFHDEDGCPDEKPERVSYRDLKGIRFEFGQAELDSSALEKIATLAEKMTIYPATSIIVYGHADPTEPNPKALGLARAQAIVSILLKSGIASDRMEAVSKSDNEPIGNNRSAKGRVQNRRVSLEPK